MDSLRSLGRPVHPRMRGERVKVAVRPEDDVGSSPHARGTRRGLCARLVGVRFIPACAGNAIDAAPNKRGQPGHPRMRGERITADAPIDPDAGSSPHARGTHFRLSFVGDGRRFIPACDGERSSERLVAIWSSGSSPHARGTHNLIMGDVIIGRFIPACAGNALQRSA